MGKTPVNMKAVVYALSPFQQKIMPGLWKDLPGKIHHKVSENWISATLLLAPLVGVYTYVQTYQENEKLKHRLLDDAMAVFDKTSTSDQGAATAGDAIAGACSSRCNICPSCSSNLGLARRPGSSAENIRRIF